MDIFGFFATIIICATIITVVWLLIRKPIEIHYTKKNVEEPPKVIFQSSAPTQTTQSAETHVDIANDSMDTVIRAANELMGIETIDKEIDNGKA